MLAAAPPRLLHVFATFATGGPQVRFANLVNHYGQRFHHMLVAMDGNYACRERLNPDLDITYPSIGFVKGATLGNLRVFRRALAELRPDLLVTSNWGSIEWALANVVPVVRHLHIEDGFGPEEQAMQIRRRVLTRRLALRRSLVVLPSRTLWTIATTIWKLDEQRLRYVPNGIDLDAFAAVPPAVLAIPGDGPVIGTVAALRAEKNLGRLLRAFALVARLRPARLVIVGDGPERPRLQALAAELGIADRVLFTGHIEKPQSTYAALDVFALSSDTEQMPMSLLEAMAAGLPAASTDVGDVGAMLDQANRPFVVARDDAALAGALGALCDDAELRKRVGTANRAKVARDYDQRAMFETYASLFEGRF